MYFGGRKTKSACFYPIVRKYWNLTELSVISDSFFEMMEPTRLEKDDLLEQKLIFLPLVLQNLSTSGNSTKLHELIFEAVLGARDFSGDSL